MIPKMENHDVHHLITGCGTNFEDEIAMQYLLLGNGKLNAHLLAAIILGTCIAGIYENLYQSL
jgi:ubiquinone biosynthesis protein Coq4